MAPAVSEKQKRFMGIVHGLQKSSKCDEGSAKVQKACKSMTRKQTADFARKTKKK